MGRKIFVSYKFKDSNVLPLTSSIWGSTVRDYVNLLEEKIDNSNHIYKGESDNEDLSNYSEDTIWEKLKDRIHDSSITIVMISKGMKEPGRSERSQWIPWEIAYSLRETTRNDRTSHTNAVLAVVLPDESGSYNYYMTDKFCCTSPCTCFNTSFLFDILASNMFNKKDKSNDRANCAIGDDVYRGYPSYIHSVQWNIFINNIDYYLQIADFIKLNIDNYEIKKQLK